MEMKCMRSFRKFMMSVGRDTDKKKVEDRTQNRG